MSSSNHKDKNIRRIFGHLMFSLSYQTTPHNHLYFSGTKSVLFALRTRKIKFQKQNNIMYLPCYKPANSEFQLQYRSVQLVDT